MVSRKLLAVLLSELNTVRLICKDSKCGMVVEMPMSQLAKKCENGICPCCRSEVVPVSSTRTNALVKLAEAVKELQDHPDKIALEFVLPDTSAD